MAQNITAQLQMVKNITAQLQMMQKITAQVSSSAPAHMQKIFKFNVNL